MSCPVCGAPTAKAYAPFCSKRCAAIDLHRWLSGAYAIPAVENDAAPEEDDPAAPDGADRWTGREP
jgi:endogenous inhibitor of DNA gyrase (YacG/DUF329 family)